jgi:hypothetical protein
MKLTIVVLDPIIDCIGFKSVLIDFREDLKDTYHLENFNEDDITREMLIEFFDQENDLVVQAFLKKILIKKQFQHRCFEQFFYLNCLLKDIRILSIKKINKKELFKNVNWVCLNHSEKYMKIKFLGFKDIKYLFTH